MLKRNSLFVILSASFLLACTKDPNTELTPTVAVAPSQSPPEPVKQVVLPQLDGPFGLKVGLTVDEVKKYIPQLKESEKPGLFTSNAVPVSHANFESYSFQFSEKSGLCSISGIGRDIESGDTGAEVRAAFSSLDEALTTKYGKGKKYDFSNQRYDSPEFWMLHLLKKNRTLAKFWDREEKSDLPETIRSIALQANATEISKAYINIRYEFSNIGECTAEQKKRNNQGL